MNVAEQFDADRASPSSSPAGNSRSPLPESSKRSRHRKHRNRSPVPKEGAAGSPQHHRRTRQQRDDPKQLDDHREPVLKAGSMLMNVRHVWADEAAAAGKGAEEGVPRISATVQDAATSEFWRPATIQTAPSPKTTSENRFQYNQRDAFLVGFGFCMGVSGLWRFPALMAEHGASFILACLVIYLLMAQPVFYLELFIGQFISSGVTKANKCFPLLTGIGYVSVWYCFLLAICHSLRVTYSVFYLVYGVSQRVPWSKCRDAWNADCYSAATEFLRCKYVNVPSQGAVNDSTTSSYAREVSLQNSMYCINASRTSSEAYFMDFVLQLSSGIHDPGEVRLQLLIPMTAVWIIVLLVCTQAPHIIHRVYKVLCGVGMLCFVPFIAESVYHHSTLDGFVASLTPDLAALTTRQIWLDAAEHSLFSLGTSSGLIFYLGSKCKYGSSYERCAVWTIVAEVTTCDLIALTTCLWVNKPGNVEGEITAAVPSQFRQLVRTAQLVVSCAYPATCNALAFTAFIAMGMMANVLLVKSCVSEITTTLGNATKTAEAWALCVVCAIAYAISVPLCTQGGLYIHHMLEQGLARNLFFVVALVQVTSFSWFYGVTMLSFDLEHMIKESVGVYWIYSWAFTVPMALLVSAALYVSEGASSGSLVIGDYAYPRWASLFVWVSSAVSLLPVPVMAVCHWIDVDKDLRKALETDPMWGPLDLDRSSYYNDRVRTFTIAMATKDKIGRYQIRDKAGSIASPSNRTVSSYTGLKN